jgi:hypothetical protein
LAVKGPANYSCLPNYERSIVELLRLRFYDLNPLRLQRVKDIDPAAMATPTANLMHVRSLNVNTRLEYSD